MSKTESIMEFKEKLKWLRKQRNLTQEQLAESLNISRTAVSKWESGRGYPNIEALKSIAALFSISIDELLSAEELIIISAPKSRFEFDKKYGLIFGILDILATVCIFLPFYGKREGDFIRAVPLSLSDGTPAIRTAYFIILLSMSAVGIAEFAFSVFTRGKKCVNAAKNCSIALHVLAILCFAASRQPYVTAFLFLLFLTKGIFLVKSSRTA